MNGVDERRGRNTHGNPDQYVVGKQLSLRHSSSALQLMQQSPLECEVIVSVQSVANLHCGVSVQVPGKTKMGLRSISQKMTSTDRKAGQPRVNHQRIRRW